MSPEIAATELAKNVAEFETVLRDAEGNARPIERIVLEPLGGQVRWSVYSEGRRLQSVTAAMRDLGGLLESTKLLLAAETGDFSGIDMEQLAADNGWQNA